MGCHCILPSCTLAPGKIMHEFHSHVRLPPCKAAVDGGTRRPPPPRLQPARGGSSGRALPPDQSPEVLCAFKWAAGVGFCFPYIFIAQLLSPPSDVLVTSRLGLTGQITIENPLCSRFQVGLLGYSNEKTKIQSVMLWKTQPV